MKKLICCLFAFCLLLASASAETFDLSKMSDADLQTLRDQIDTELARRHQAKSGEVIYEGSDCRVVYLGAELRETYSGDKRVVLNLEWTNLSSKKTHLSWSLDAEAYADGVEVYCTTDGFYTDIKPNVTYQASVSCTVPDGAKELEVNFTSWLGYETYKTYTFDLR